MKASPNHPDYRNGDWGPAYLIQDPSSDMGVLLLGPATRCPTTCTALRRVVRRA